MSATQYVAGVLDSMGKILTQSMKTTLQHFTVATLKGVMVFFAQFSSGCDNQKLKSTAWV